MTGESTSGAGPRSSPSLEDLHASALDRLGKIVRAASGSELWNPTPCADWNVHQVIEHTVGLNYGFAEALVTGTAGEDAYRSRPIEHWSDSVTAVRQAVASVEGSDGVSVIAPVSDELTPEGRCRSDPPARHPGPHLGRGRRPGCRLHPHGGGHRVDQ